MGIEAMKSLGGPRLSGGVVLFTENQEFDLSYLERISD